MVRSCDVWLAQVVDKTTGLLKDEQKYAEAMAEVYETFGDTPTGEELKKICGDLTEERVAPILRIVQERIEARHGKPGTIGDWPGVWFCYRLEEIISALIRVKHPVLAQVSAKVEPPKETEQERFDTLVAQVL